LNEDRAGGTRASVDEVVVSSYATVLEASFGDVNVPAISCGNRDRAVTRGCRVRTGVDAKELDRSSNATSKLQQSDVTIMRVQCGCVVAYNLAYRRRSSCLTLGNWGGNGDKGREKKNDQRLEEHFENARYGRGNPQGAKNLKAAKKENGSTWTCKGEERQLQDEGK